MKKTAKLLVLLFTSALLFSLLDPVIYIFPLNGCFALEIVAVLSLKISVSGYSYVYPCLFRSYFSFYRKKQYLNLRLFD